jgi:hypothetical protein
MEMISKEMDEAGRILIFQGGGIQVPNPKKC